MKFNGKVGLELIVIICIHILVIVFFNHILIGINFLIKKIKGE
jgi:hypothetical protein